MIENLIFQSDVVFVFAAYLLNFSIDYKRNTKPTHAEKKKQFVHCLVVCPGTLRREYFNETLLHTMNEHRK